MEYTTETKDGLDNAPTFPKLLMVYPYAFGTGWSGATPRIMHVAKGLTRLGWEVTLVRSKQGNEAQLAPVLEAFPGRVITTRFNGPFPAFFNCKGLRKVYTLFRRLAGFPVEDDAADAFARRLLSFAQKGSVIGKPDLIWGITVGFLTGPLSAELLGAYFRCPFLIEFHDPVPHPGRPALALRKHKLFDQCLSRSSVVITTTEGITNKVQKDFPTTRGKVRTFHMSYDDDVTMPNLGEPTLNVDSLLLVHAGVLYGGAGRNATSLVKAIAEAVKLNPAIQGRIKLRLIGAGEGGEEAAKIAREVGVAWAVETMAQIPAQACIAEMRRADVLVVIKFDDAEYDLQVPGKVFQYLGFGKPVLGLMRETEAARILRAAGVGIVVANSDVGGAANAILDLWKHRATLSEKFRPRWDYIRKFSVSSSSKNLNLELLRVIDPKGSKRACALSF